MNSREYRRHIRRSKMSKDADERNRRRCATAMFICVSANIAFAVCCMQMSASYAWAEEKESGDPIRSECFASMQWPLEQARIVGGYDAPAKRWLPGHRGVDLQADAQEAIIAPADGTIAFSGKVAGKSVVTLRHGADAGNLTSTFEPAITTHAVGTSIFKGERFARVEGNSEHCSDRCLHWGLKGGGRDYVNPSGKVRAVRIGLKAI